MDHYQKHDHLFQSNQMKKQNHFEKRLMYQNHEFLQEFVYNLIQCEEKANILRTVWIQMSALCVKCFPSFVKNSFVTSVGLIKFLKDLYKVVSVCPHREQLENCEEKQMNSVVMVYQNCVCLAW